MKNIKHVAVLGAGIMGGQIAAFFANLGITSDLYDIDIDIVKKTLKKMTDPKLKIPMLYTSRFARKIRPRAMDDMETALAKADLIVEAIPEKMELKRQVFEKVAKWRKPESIIATNTSGLSINQMSTIMPEDMAKNFLGVHYFNPVRFLPLVEVIAGEKTNPAIVSDLMDFYAGIGKKAVLCKDTPNFIANRIGIFSLMQTLVLMDKYHLDVDTVDMITGPPLGNPKTATLRLCDMVGIDTLIAVAQNVYENCPQDEYREIFKIPDWLQRMLDEKMLGEKTGKGFYQKTPKREILSLDIASWEYQPRKKPKSEIIKVAREYADIGQRIHTICSGDSTISKFCRELILHTAAYSLNRVGEIADSIWAIDSAIKWGFMRKVGPIEVVDALGIKKTCDLMQECNIKIPPLLEKVPAKDHIYRVSERSVHCFQPATGDYEELPQPKDAIQLHVLKSDAKVVRHNLSTSLIDLGDGVLLLELAHRMVPNMNPVDEFVVAMMAQIPFVMKDEGFKALVIGNQSEHFCAGAQLQLLLELSKEKKWKEIEEACAAFENVNMALHHADFPVVVAPHGMALGGGMEITLAGHKRVALAEFYGGLVEVGVGLLPGGAGNLLLLMQFIEAMEEQNPGPMFPAARAFELIAYGTVSNSAHDAINRGLLKRDDVVVINKDQQIKRAKEVALELSENHTPKPLRDLYLPGTGGYMALESMIDDLVVSGKLTEHGAVIAKKQAYVITGGQKASTVSPISEQHFLELEREAFVELCSTSKTQDRIQHMLKFKKPLFN